MFGILSDDMLITRTSGLEAIIALIYKTRTAINNDNLGFDHMVSYRPHGKRSLGRPLKRWSETVTGHLA
jgi:hypothetical protein